MIHPGMERSVLLASLLALGAGSSRAATPIDGFVPNVGQWPGEAEFFGVAGGGRVRVDADGWSMVRDSAEGPYVVRFIVREAVEPARVVARSALPGRVSFFLGTDAARWASDLPTYREVVWEGVRPGADLVLRARAERLEYELEFARGVEAGVVVDCLGAEELSIDDRGGLVIRTPVGDLRQSPPIAWQTGPDGGRVPAEVRFEVVGDTAFAFRHSPLDPALPTTIDPGLEWSTLLGGVVPAPDQFPAINEPREAIVLDDGAVLIAGTTGRIDFPGTPGTYAPSYIGGACDAFATKLSADGSHLVQSTFLGGSEHDRVLDMARASDGTVFLVGEHVSPDFPTTPGAFSTPGFVGSAMFVSVLDESLSSVLRSASFGFGAEGPDAIAVAPNGDPIVLGTTFDASLPFTRSAPDSNVQGSEAFLLRMKSDLSDLVFVTALGGTQNEVPYDVALRSDGSIVVVGSTYSPDFPTTPGAFDSNLNPVNSNPDGFVTVVDAQGTRIVHSTLLGMLGREDLRAVHVDDAGFVTVTGRTSSQDYPVTPGAFQSGCTGNCWDGIVTRLVPDLSGLVWSTRIGGADIEEFDDLAVDRSGAPTVIGYSLSETSYPTTAGAWEEAYTTTWHQVVLARFRPDVGGLVYSSALGGSGDDGWPWRLFVDVGVDGSATAVGVTQSLDFPTTPGAFDAAAPKGKIFVTRFDMLPTGVTRRGDSTAGGQGKVAAGVTAIPSLDNPEFGLSCVGGPKSALGFLGLSAGALPAPVLACDAQVWLDPASLVLFPIASDATGSVWAPTSIPSSAVSAGLAAHVQFFWPDAFAPGGWSSSYALEIVVQP
ncbi:MAG: hypothetical protein ACF8XB_02825 [Planctomycetota bacterium JB042]